MNISNEIKSYIVREGMTISEVLERLVEEHGWNASVPNFSGKLQRGSLRYSEAKELADMLGYDLIWLKRPPDFSRLAADTKFAAPSKTLAISAIISSGGDHMADSNVTKTALAGRCGSSWKSSCSR